MELTAKEKAYISTALATLADLYKSVGQFENEKFAMELALKIQGVK